MGSCMSFLRFRSWRPLLLGAAVELCACDTLKSEPIPVPQDVVLSEPRVTVKTEGPEYCREGLWTLDVSVEGGAPESVELVTNGQDATPLDAPYRYTVDCGTHAEGAFTFVARATAKGRGFESPAVSVVVDRQAPFVESWRPESYYPSFDAPVEVVFSEPVLFESLVATSTVLRKADDTVVPHQAVLSEDGRVLRLAPDSPLTEPVSLRAELPAQGITDRAGNPLVLEHGAGAARQVDYWPFTQVGPRLTSKALEGLSFALDFTPQPEPVVAFVERDPRNPDDVGELVVQRMRGGAWERLPSPRTQEARARRPAAPRLELYGWQVVLAWTEPDPENPSWDVILVSRYDGSAWTLLGLPLVTRSSSVAFQMALDPEGNPALVYQEDGGAQLRVVRWGRAADWEFLGGPLNDNPTSGTPAEHPAIVAETSRVVVAWSETMLGEGFRRVVVMQHENDNWSLLGVPLNGRRAEGNTEDVALALGRSNESPIVAWVERAADSSSGAVFTSSYRLGAVSRSWSEPTELQAEAPFEALGGLRLIVDSGLEPWVVWTRQEEGQGAVTCYRRRSFGRWAPEQVIAGGDVAGFRLDFDLRPWAAVGDSPRDAILQPQ